MSTALDALCRETLATGSGSSVKLASNAFVRTTLLSLIQYPQLRFDAVARTSLILTLPTDPPIPVFPALPQGFPVNVSPVVDTTIGTTKSLREIRAPQQEYPLWDIELRFEELLDQTQNQVPFPPFAGIQEYEQLVQLWLMMYGQTNVFAFDSPWDNSRLNQVIGVGDGQTYIFTIYRTWGVGDVATQAPIGSINAITEVKVNGITVPPTHYYAIRNKLYFIGPNGQIYPPANAAIVTVTFSFYYLCKFVEDEQSFEEFSKNRWTVSSLKFRAVIWV